MKFQDLFVPRWQHSNPDIRKKAVTKLADLRLLKQIAEKDEDPTVREIALECLSQFTGQQVKVTMQK